MIRIDLKPLVLSVILVGLIQISLMAVATMFLAPFMIVLTGLGVVVLFLFMARMPLSIEVFDGSMTIDLMLEKKIFFRGEIQRVEYVAQNEAVGLLLTFILGTWGFMIWLLLAKARLELMDGSVQEVCIPPVAMAEVRRILF